MSMSLPLPYRIMVLRKLPCGRGSIFICLIISPFIDAANKIVGCDDFVILVVFH